MRPVIAFVVAGSLVAAVAFVLWGDGPFKSGALSPAEAQDVSEADPVPPSAGFREVVESNPSVQEAASEAASQVASSDIQFGAAGESESFSDLEARFRAKKAAAHSAKSRAALEEIDAGRFEFSTDSDAASLEPRLHRPPEEPDSTFLRVATGGRTYLIRLRRQDHPKVFELVDGVRALEREVSARSTAGRRAVESVVEYRSQ
jgi:hypothetical protein